MPFLKLSFVRWSTFWRLVVLGEGETERERRDMLSMFLTDRARSLAQFMCW
jgi:hypothetical protein